MVKIAAEETKLRLYYKSMTTMGAKDYNAKNFAARPASTLNLFTKI